MKPIFTYRNFHSNSQENKFFDINPCIHKIESSIMIATIVHIQTVPRIKITHNFVWTLSITHTASKHNRIASDDKTQSLRIIVLTLTRARTHTCVQNLH